RQREAGGEPARRESGDGPPVRDLAVSPLQGDQPRSAHGPRLPAWQRRSVAISAGARHVITIADGWGQVYALDGRRPAGHPRVQGEPLVDTLMTSRQQILKTIAGA